MSDEKPSVVPVEELRDVARASDWYEGSRLVRSAVASIPIVGGALDQIFSGGATARARERVDTFVSDVADELRRLDDRLTAATDRDALVDLMRLVLTRVASTRTAEKRERFLNIVVHQAVVGSRIDDAEAAVELLDRLSDLDVAVLIEALTGADHELPDGIRVICLERRRHLGTQSAPLLGERFPSVSQAHLTLSCAKLVANGLLLDEGVGRFDCGSLEYLRATELGMWFVDWVRAVSA